MPLYITGGVQLYGMIGMHGLLRENKREIPDPWYGYQVNNINNWSNQSRGFGLTSSIRIRPVKQIRKIESGAELKETYLC